MGHTFVMPVAVVCAVWLVRDLMVRGGFGRERGGAGRVWARGRVRLGGDYRGVCEAGHCVLSQGRWLWWCRGFGGGGRWKGEFKIRKLEAKSNTQALTHSLYYRMLNAQDALACLSCCHFLNAPSHLIILCICRCAPKFQVSLDNLIHRSQEVLLRGHLSPRSNGEHARLRSHTPQLCPRAVGT